ncbi:MAG TPA: hypothetical protein VJ697_07555 [Nitrososphaeraceae archaeon]|nr:hypothetical protein [Nitrososphaeraceae archaeon]
MNNSSYIIKRNFFPFIDLIDIRYLSPLPDIQETPTHLSKDNTLEVSHTQAQKLHTNNTILQ